MSSHSNRYLIRRRSVTTMTENHSSNLNDTLEALHNLWDEAGMDDQMRKERVITFFEHIENLQREMLTSEQTMLSELRSKIKELSIKVESISSLLNLANHLDEFENLELIERMEVLRNEYKRLEEIKKRRLSQFTDLKLSDEKLSLKLDTVQFVTNREVPSESDLVDFNEHVERMEQLFESRAREFEEGRVELLRIVKRMNRPIGDKLGKLVLDHPESFVLSTSNMESLLFLLDETREQYNEYVREFRIRFDILENQVSIMRQKCQICEWDRPLPPFDDDSISECLLQSYQDELAHLEKYYTERQEVLTKYDEWKQYWDEKLEHDRKETDPSRYTNRGCNLQKELTRKRKVEHTLLPKSRTALLEAMRSWQQSHPGNPILIQGVDPARLIQLTMSEYIESRELEKEQKQEEKKRQLITESHYGISPAKQTPVLKRIRTPALSSNKPFPVMQKTPLMKRTKMTPAKKEIQAEIDTPLRTPRPPTEELMESVNYERFTVKYNPRIYIKSLSLINRSYKLLFVFYIFDGNSRKSTPRWKQHASPFQFYVS